LGKLSLGVLSEEVRGKPAEKILNDILADLYSSETAGTSAEELVSSIRMHRKAERYRTLRAKLERGDIQRTDAEFEEYWDLARELKLARELHA
jgi:hypothetical protein